jgi:hypothetical protein
MSVSDNTAVVDQGDHNRADEASCRLDQRALLTNNPFAPPVGLPPRARRRYRDLMFDYRKRLGQRVERPDVQARLRSLVWLQIELERLQIERLREGENKREFYTVLHATQEHSHLLAELGLSELQSMSWSDKRAPASNGVGKPSGLLHEALAPESPWASELINGKHAAD